MAVLLWRTAPRQTHATPDKGLLSPFWAGGGVVAANSRFSTSLTVRHTGSRGNGAEADSTMQNKNPQPTCKSTSTSHRALASPCEETSTHTRAHAHTHALASDPCAPTHMHHHVIKHTLHAVIHTHTWWWRSAQSRMPIITRRLGGSSGGRGSAVVQINRSLCCRSPAANTSPHPHQASSVTDQRRRQSLEAAEPRASQQQPPTPHAGCAPAA